MYDETQFVQKKLVIIRPKISIPVPDVNVLSRIPIVSFRGLMHAYKTIFK